MQFILLTNCSFFVGMIKDKPVMSAVISLHPKSPTGSSERTKTYISIEYCCTYILSDDCLYPGMI